MILRYSPIIILLFALWFGLSIAFMWPPICRYGGRSASACLNHLRQIDGAKQLWALETHQKNGAVVTTNELYPYLLRDAFHCPCGGIYTLGAIGENPVCSLATNAAPPPFQQLV